MQSLTSQHVDARAVGIARILVGAVSFVFLSIQSVFVMRVTSGEWMSVPYSSSIPVLPERLLPAFILASLVLSILFAAGYRTRAVGVTLCLVVGYSQVIDQQAYGNHMYLLLIVLFLLTLANSGGRFSIDERLGRATHLTPYWPVFLLKVQLSIVYFFGAVSKINSFYLSGEGMVEDLSNGLLFSLPSAWQLPVVSIPLAVGSVMTELFLAVALWSSRSRPAAIVVGVAFHTVIVAMMEPHKTPVLTAFGFLMFAMYLQFVNLDALRGYSLALPRLPIRRSHIA